MNWTPHGIDIIPMLHWQGLCQEKKESITFHQEERIGYK